MELTAAITQGTAMWPTLQVGSVLQAALQAWVAAGHATDFKESTLRDLAIAAAVAGSDRAAVEEFDRFYIRTRTAVIAKHGLPNDVIADVLQTVRYKMLAKIADLPAAVQVVAGGDLLGLATVVAHRTAIDFVRKMGRSVAINDAAEFDSLMASIGTPESALGKHQLKEVLRAALTASLADIVPTDRTILRLHFLHHMSIDDLATLYDVHRATAARWIVKICDDVGAGCRRYLEAQRETVDLATAWQLIQSGMSSGFLGLRSMLTAA